MPTRLNSRSLINVLPNLQPPSEVFRLGDIFNEATRGHYQSGATSRIGRDPQLLRLPLIRGGKVLSIGHDEESWKAMLAWPLDSCRRGHAVCGRASGRLRRRSGSAPSRDAT